MTYQPLSLTAIQQILALVSAADGQPRGEPDEQLWLGVAHRERWRASEARAAVTELACRWTGEFGRQITPGVAAAEIKRVRSQPQPFAEQVAELPPVEEASPERRRELMAAWVAEQAAKKSMPSAHPEEGEVDPFVAGRRAGWTPPDWAAIGACGLCDERGIRLDVVDVVCSHPRTGEDHNEGSDEVVGSGAHTPTTEEEADHD